MTVARVATASDAARRAPAAGLLTITCALLLGLQAIRVFTTHTVWLIGETSSREVLGIVVLGGFAAAILAWPLARAVGLQAASLWSLRLLAAGAAVGQISAVPGIDFAAGLVGTIAAGLVPGVAARIGIGGAHGSCSGAGARSDRSRQLHHRGCAVCPPSGGFGGCRHRRRHRCAWRSGSCSSSNATTGVARCLAAHRDRPWAGGFPATQRKPGPGHRGGGS